MDWRIADVAFYRARGADTTRSSAFVADWGAVERDGHKLQFTGKKQTIEMADVSLVELTRQWTLNRVAGIVLGGIAGLIVVFLAPIAFAVPPPAPWMIIAFDLALVPLFVYYAWYDPEFKDASRLRTYMIRVVFRDATGQRREVYFEDWSPGGRLLERLKGEVPRARGNAA